MIRRSVWVKAAAFVVIAVLGIGYVAVHYIGVGQRLLGRSYTVYVDLPDSGGLFTTASVTYRGVEVGRVGTIQLHGDGIRVALDLTGSRKIPTDARAIVGNGSPIGEQYVDLRPVTSARPYLHDGSVIPASHATLPTSTQDLLVNLDRLVRSVPREDLHTVVTELGTAFADTGARLRAMLRASDALLHTARRNLPATAGLIDDAEVALGTQNDLSSSIRAFSRNLAVFTDALRTGDADLRAVLRNAPPSATALVALDRGVDATLPLLLQNLTSLGQVSAARVPAIRQVLIIYPYVVSTSFGLFPHNGTTRFGVPIPPANDHQPCKKGYWPVDKRRLPGALRYPPVRWDAFCKEPTTADVNVRGSRMAPQPGGGRLGDKKGYRNNSGLPGDGHWTFGGRGYRSWMSLLFGPMA